MQDRDIDKALDGFTRAVQLDPDNGEAWNNIACVYVLAFHFFFPFQVILCSGLVLAVFLLACLTLYIILVTASFSFVKSICGCIRA